VLTNVFPAPKRRLPGEQTPSTRGPSKLNDQVLKETMAQVFGDKLRKSMFGVAKQLAQTKSATQDFVKLNEKLSKFQQETLSIRRIWRGFFNDVDLAGRFPEGASYATVGKGHNVVEEWKQYVRSNFEDLVDTTRQYYTSILGSSDKKLAEFSEPDRTRAVNTTLASILRTDIDTEHQNLFLKKCETTSIMLSDMKSELCSLLQYLILQAARRGIEVVGSSNNTTYQFGKNDRDKESNFNVNQLLPEYAVRHTQYLVDRESIPIAPLPLVDTKATNFKDLLNMFRRDHLESLYTHFLAAKKKASPVERNEGQSSNQRSASDHALWQQLSVDMSSLQSVECPGLSQTVNTSIESISTNMDNMYKGNLFSKSLDRLLLVCLRTNLAPKREERYFELLKRQRSKPKKQPDVTNNINRIRQLLHKENKNLTKCYRKLEDCASVSADSEAWNERISSAKARISNLVRELDLAKSRKRLSSITEGKPASIKMVNIEKNN
jgi:hypothetical protein